MVALLGRDESVSALQLDHGAETAFRRDAVALLVFLVGLFFLLRDLGAVVTRAGAAGHEERVDLVLRIELLVDDVLHPDAVGGLGHEAAGGHGLAVAAVVVLVGVFPADDHHARAERIELADQRHVVAVAGHQHDHVESDVDHLFVGFEREGDVRALFGAVAHGQEMRDHAFAGQHVVEIALGEEQMAEVRLGRGQAAAEIMAVDDAAEVFAYMFAFRHHGADEAVQTGHADAAFARMPVVIIVADVIEVVSIVEDADPD